MKYQSDSKTIFKKASTTFFNSTLFFPKDVREDVFDLYAFLRTVDDFVDNEPAQKDSFYVYKEIFEKQWNGMRMGDGVMERFVQVAKKHNFYKSWVTSFFDAMESDLYEQKCQTRKDTERYVYGSAEVVGLMMSSILQMNEEYRHYARFLGRSFQYSNFIRDIAEDNKLGRQYLPIDEMKEAGLESLEYDYVLNNQAAFKIFIHKQCEIHDETLAEANKGFKHVKHQYAIPMKTASDMYTWALNTIRKDPMIVYEKKVKPSKFRVYAYIIKNFLRL